MGLRVYNTLTRQKEDFVPLEPGKVKMYSCGPTVYDYFHIGNARAFVVPDVIKRYFRYRGYEVFHVQNITDIEDKIITKANDAGVSYKDIVAQFTDAYLEDVKALNCSSADVNPKASEHVEQMIDHIDALVQKGIAYPSGGDVYFDVTRFPRYGKLSNQGIEDLAAGARVEVGENKRHPMDFTLWKSAKPGEPAWDSPWGKGRPGWHIECSVMSMAYLGETFDIHTGGADLVFPHHENEIAQSEAKTEHPFVHYWIHNGYINIAGEKMSKSKGNFFTLRDILREFDAEVVRLFLISKHYRSPIDFSRAEMESTRRGLARLQDASANLRRLLASGDPDAADGGDAPPQTSTEVQFAESLEQVRQKFIAAMDDDFNTALALASLYDLAREVNRWINDNSFAMRPTTFDLLQRADELFAELAGVLGILQSTPDAQEVDDSLVDDLLNLLIAVRQRARDNRDWGTADEVRNRLNALGIVLEDTPSGTRWKRENR